MLVLLRGFKSAPGASASDVLKFTDDLLNLNLHTDGGLGFGVRRTLTFA